MLRTLILIVSFGTAALPLSKASEDVQYQLDKPGMVSINIYGESGQIVRNLLNGAPRKTGENIEFWDGLDDDAKPVPVGKYTWKLLETQGLSATRLSEVGTTLPSESKYPGKMHMIGLGNQSAATAVVVDNDSIYAVAPGAENVRAGLKMTLDGKLSWSEGNAQGFVNWHDIAVINNTCYYLLNDATLARYPADKGYPGGTAIPSVNVSWEGDPKPDAWHEYLMRNYDLAGGQSARGPQLVLSNASRNAIRWLDLDSGKKLAEASVASPRGLAVEADGNILAISGTNVVRLSLKDATPHPFITGLVDPWRLAEDKTTGDVLIADLGKSQQIKRFSHAGTLLATYGRLGGRGYGLYDPQQFQDVADISSDGHQGFVIIENCSPKRIAHFDQNGKLVREWYCAATGIASCFSLDPDDPSIVWYESQWGGEITRAKVDFKSRTWTVHSTYQIKGAGDCIPNSYGDPIPGFDIRKKSGTTYLCSRGGSTWNVFRLDEKSWTFRPVSEITPEIAKLNSSSSIVWKLVAKDPLHRKAYQWTDLNGDGIQDENEFTWYDKPYSEGPVGSSLATSGDDLSWHIGTPAYLPTSGSYFRLSPLSWTQAGVPIYPGPSVAPLGTYPKDITDVSHDMLVSQSKDNSTYEALNFFPADYEGFLDWGNVGANRLIKWSTKGRVIWELKPPHNPLSIYDSRGGYLKPGEVGKLRTTIARVKDCEVVCEKEGAWNGNFPGTASCWDSDGLWVGNLLENPDLTKGDVSDYEMSSEPWWIAVREKKPDTVLLYGNWENQIRIWEIKGWDHWVRKSGKVEVAESGTRAGLRQTLFRDPAFTLPIRIQGASHIELAPMEEVAGSRWTGRIKSAQGVDFGSGTWNRHNKTGELTDLKALSGSFHLPANTFLSSITLVNPNMGTYKVHDGVNPDVTGTFVDKNPVVVSTHWSNSASTITISYSAPQGAIASINYMGNGGLSGQYSFGPMPDWQTRVLSDIHGEEQFRFRVQGAQSVRLFLGNKLLINHGMDHNDPDVSPPVTLSADQAVDLRLDVSGITPKGVKLEWSSASLPWSQIPPRAFSPVVLDPFLESRASVSVPGLIDCEAFEDGEGVGYHANKSVNVDHDNNPGFDYRPGCGISVLGPVWSSPYRFTGVVYGAKGEWLDYVVNVPVGGNYACSFILRNDIVPPSHPEIQFEGGIFHLEADGTDVTGPLVVPSFDSDLPKTLTSDRIMSLTPGKHTLRLVFDQNGRTDWMPYVAKFDQIEIRRISK